MTNFSQRSTLQAIFSKSSLLRPQPQTTGSVAFPAGKLRETASEETAQHRGSAVFREGGTEAAPAAPGRFPDAAGPCFVQSRTAGAFSSRYGGDAPAPLRKIPKGACNDKRSFGQPVQQVQAGPEKMPREKRAGENVRGRNGDAGRPAHVRCPGLHGSRLSCFSQSGVVGNVFAGQPGK